MLERLTDILFLELSALSPRFWQIAEARFAPLAPLRHTVHRHVAAPGKSSREDMGSSDPDESADDKVWPQRRKRSIPLGGAWVGQH